VTRNSNSLALNFSRFDCGQFVSNGTSNTSLKPALSRLAISEGKDKVATLVFLDLILGNFYQMAHLAKA